MAIGTGYSKVTTNGLVFAYDTGDTRNSYTGRPTTNISAGIGMNVYNNVPGNVSSTLAGTGTYYRGAEIIKQTLTALDGSGAGYLSGGNNPGIGVYTGGGGGTGGRYTGHSIFFKPTFPVTSCPVYTHYSNIGGWQSTCNFEDMGDGWFRAYVLWYGGSTQSDGKYWAINPLSTPSGATITLYWAGPFKEDLNSTSISQFVNGTRSDSQGLINLSETNPQIGLITTSLTNMSYTNPAINPQITFDATDDFINTNFPIFSFPQVTMEAVVYDTRNNGGYRAIIQNNVNSDDALYIYPNNTLGFWPCGGGSLTVPSNQWNYVAVTYNGSSFTYYVNGQSQTINSSCADITDFQFLRIGGYGAGDGERWGGQIPIAKVYNRALSAGEVRDNYNHYKTRFTLP
jgi:hypothetical protein